MIRPAIACLALMLTLVPAVPAAETAVQDDRLVDGTYPDERLAAVTSFTLPRTFLYEADGTLIPQEEWPAELAELKQHAGDAYCCVSDTPVPPGSDGPPPDCERLVYGTDVHESFDGLVDRSGAPITYTALPEHRRLLVEYYASWCLPCVAGRKALESFIATPAAEGYLWVAIDMSRLPEAQKAAAEAREASSP